MRILEYLQEDSRHRGRSSCQGQAYLPHQDSIYSNYNQIKTIAKRAGEFILINHFISMVDALFLSKISINPNWEKAPW